MMVAAYSPLAFARPLIASSPPDVIDQKYLDSLLDDRQFIASLRGAMRPNNLSMGAPDAYNAIINAAEANVGSLNAEERAQIIQSAWRIPAAGYRSQATSAATALVQSIERLSNNQGYTGPDAAVVVATTPTAAGYPMPITRGEILDNENFSNLVDKVFMAAGGKSSLPASLQGRGLPITGLPGSSFVLAGPRGAALSDNMSKWSEAERVEYLNKVAEFGRDGTLSAQEEGQLALLARNNLSGGDSEPIAVTSTSASFFGKSGAISKDDLMENGTFEKLLNSTALWGTGRSSTEVTALKNAIATADYDSLGYEERVALVQAFNAANSDHSVNAQELTALTKMLQDFQSGGSGVAARQGTTLSNGLLVRDSDVKGSEHFMSVVNAVLDRSGVTTATVGFNGTTTYGATPFTENQSTLPLLRGLDVSRLTPAQRVEILEMISHAGSDRRVTFDEANAISARVNELSGPASSRYPMA
jgi:hypothetical protein